MTLSHLLSVRHLIRPLKIPSRKLSLSIRHLIHPLKVRSRRPSFKQVSEFFDFVKNILAETAWCAARYAL